MNESPNRESPGLWAYLKAFLMLSLIALGWLLLGHSELAGQFDNYNWARDRVEQYGIYGPILFVVLFGLSTVIGIPRLLISAIAGFVFDFFPAVLIALAATLVGCITSFFYARFMGRAIIRDLMSLRMRNFEKLLI